MNKCFFQFLVGQQVPLYLNNFEKLIYSIEAIKDEMLLLLPAVWTAVILSSQLSNQCLV